MRGFLDPGDKPRDDSVAGFGDAHRRRFALLLALVLILSAAAASAAEPKFPPLTGRIVDEGNLLSAADRAEITQQLADLESKSTDQLVVFTTRSLQGYPIEDFGYRLGRAWGIGQQGKNNGVILIVAPSERSVRIEVGRGLEGQLTDLMSKLIIENAILPAFRRGDFAGGIKAGVRDIRDVLLGDAEEVKKRAAHRPQVQRIDTGAMLLLAFWLLVFAFVLWAIYQQARRGPPGAVRRRTGDGGIIVAPGGWGGSGSWGGGGSSGGGWSGGGGDFGGGGGSGSW